MAMARSASRCCPEGSPRTARSLSRTPAGAIPCPRTPGMGEVRLTPTSREPSCVLPGAGSRVGKAPLLLRARYRASMTPETSEVIRLWPDGPPTRIDDMPDEVEFEVPEGIAKGTTFLRNISDPTLTVFEPAD